MRPYKWESDNTFITCISTDTLLVYELNAPSPKVVKESDWNLIATIETKLDSDDGWFNCLQITDDKIIAGHQLKMLAEHIYFARLIVNREGLCYIDTLGVTDYAFPVYFFRLNDLFNWSKFDHRPTIKTIWGRCCMDDGSSIDFSIGHPDAHKEEQDRSCEDSKCKEEQVIKEDQLSSLTACRKKLKAKEEEVKELNEKLTSRDKEIAELRKKLEECSKRLADSDDDSGPSNIGNLSLEDLSIIVQQRYEDLPSRAFRISTSRLPVPSQIRPRPGGRPLREFTPLDEWIGGQFPRDREVAVYTGDGDFDTNKCKVIKAVENNKRYMLALYEGLKVPIDYGETRVFLPFKNNTTFSSNIPFFLANVRGYGIYCSFTY